MAASTADLIRTAVERFQAEVPALEKLKLVFGLQLKAHHDIQLYRVEVPGPVIKKDLAQDDFFVDIHPTKSFNVSSLISI